PPTAPVSGGPRPGAPHFPSRPYERRPPPRHAPPRRPGDLVRGLRDRSVGPGLPGAHLAGRPRRGDGVTRDRRRPRTALERPLRAAPAGYALRRGPPRPPAGGRRRRVVLGRGSGPLGDLVRGGRRRSAGGRGGDAHTAAGAGCDRPVRPLRPYGSRAPGDRGRP